MRHSLKAVVVAALTLSACSSSDATANPIAGTWTLTAAHTTPTGQPTIDVVAAGMTMTLVITSGNATSGSLYTPGQFTESGSPETLSMAGTATLTGTTVHFTQTADTFVRDFSWALNGSTMTATDSRSSAVSDFTLTRH